MLWTVYGTEAKSYDNVRINTLKDDMDGVLVYRITQVERLDRFQGKMPLTINRPL